MFAKVIGLTTVAVLYSGGGVEADVTDAAWMQSFQSSFTVQTVASATKCELPSALVTSLTNNGFTKCACPFGVLVAGTATYPDGLLKYAANVIANLIDQNGDGQVDNTAVWTSLTYTKPSGSSVKGAMMACGVTQAEEAKEEQVTNDNVVDMSFSCQTWKASSSATELGLKAILFEEVFHMTHQRGWAVAFPAQLGLSDWTSVVCKETARLTCVKPGWHHEENTCPAGAPFTATGDPKTFQSTATLPLTGTCNDPSCDCAEFYRQAFTLKVGMASAGYPECWYSPYMPSYGNGATANVGSHGTAQAAFYAMASSELITMMNSTAYGQPQEPITGTYAVTGPCGTSTATSCAATTAAASTTTATSATTAPAACCVLPPSATTAAASTTTATSTTATPTTTTVDGGLSHSDSGASAVTCAAVLMSFLAGLM